MRTRDENFRLRDRQAIDRIADMLADRIRFAEAEHRADRSHGRLDDAALGIRTQTRLEQLEQAIRNGLFDRLDADSTTGAFVDVADAERYAQREEFVNATGDLIGAMGRHSSTHGTTAVYDAADPHDAALAQRARTEHVDYAEAEAVREIEEEMALEAAGVESWDQL